MHYNNKDKATAIQADSSTLSKHTNKANGLTFDQCSYKSGVSGSILKVKMKEKSLYLHNIKLNQ